ncbi:DUF726-domain-containing protein [Lindgomyces ingoldianus]|uniref:DUF726-domain-containing protein n=1 Tax=Lindgomyces ingoldianus TaxID=673940 RepID=A0ACB6QWN9_9PLEO|nr:DUF726-domain-containing protein [Lindgomyces ingoldianus]KAF2470495.1 DUF726-domain-containing protein [Lindgomyces ingoldianus]
MLYKVANVITGSGAEASTPDEGASLTSVLETPTLRVELALLVLLCTDAMRSDLIATFDPNKTHETASSTAPPPPPSPKPRTSPAQDLISFDEPQDEALIVAERARRVRQREVESTQMQGLRRGALTFFDKWRAGVMHRICDVLCVRGEVVRQAKAKRKQALDESERISQGNSLLVDFGGDPFGAVDHRGKGKRSHGYYEVIETKLLGFDEPKKVLILHCLLLLLLSLEHYPAHSRVLLLHLSSSLEIEVDVLAEHEKSVAQGLLASAASQMDAEESAKKQAANDSASRKWKIGLAAVGGAVLIGVTGGLAAPLLAAGVGTVMGGLGLGATVISGYLGALAGSTVLVGSLFGAYGGKMTGRLMKQYAREVQDFEFIPIQDPERPSAQHSHEWSEDQDARDPSKREQHRLRVCIGISGWLNSPSDVNKPWEVIEASGIEPFSLRFEMDAMLRLGNSLNDVLFSYAWDGVTYTVVSRTLLGALYAGLWPLGLVKVASVLDNPFSVALARADKAGKVLARALIDKVQGERPVTLTGYSIGARVIYSCLVELAEQNAFGLVESVVLMGAPVPSDTRSWRQIRSVVAARVVNVYSTEDYILGFLYRASKLQIGVAGLQDVKGVFGIENVDMSKLVNSHDKYRFLVGNILTKIGLGDIDFSKVAEQERALELVERKKKQVREHVKKHKQDTRQRDPSAAGPSELIVVQDKKTNDFADASNPTPNLPLSADARRQLQRQITTQRTGQQPAPAPSPVMDPLSGSIPIQTRNDTSSNSPHISPAPFPVASLTHRQIPSNMVPTPPAPPRSNELVDSSDDEEDPKIVMRDIDDHKFSPPMDEMMRMSVKQPEPPEGIPTVALTSVEPEEESDDEVSSEFGELSMVEPLPLDDGDMGLM